MTEEPEPESPATLNCGLATARAGEPPASTQEAESPAESDRDLAKVGKDICSECQGDHEARTYSEDYGESV